MTKISSNPAIHFTTVDSLGFVSPTASLPYYTQGSTLATHWGVGGLGGIDGKRYLHYPAMNFYINEDGTVRAFNQESIPIVTIDGTNYIDLMVPGSEGKYELHGPRHYNWQTRKYDLGQTYYRIPIGHTKLYNELGVATVKNTDVPKSTPIIVEPVKNTPIIPVSKSVVIPKLDSVPSITADTIPVKPSVKTTTNDTIPISEVVVPFSEDTVSRMREKHPIIVLSSEPPKRVVYLEYNGRYYPVDFMTGIINQDNVKDSVSQDSEFINIECENCMDKLRKYNPTFYWKAGGKMNYLELFK